MPPDLGWLYIPSHIYTSTKPDFKPLPLERDQSVKEIEDSFLKNLIISDFVYITGIGGYVGCSTAFELGFALAENKPIYALKPLDHNQTGFNDINLQSMLNNKICVLPIKDVVAHFNSAPAKELSDSKIQLEDPAHPLISAAICSCMSK